MFVRTLTDVMVGNKTIMEGHTAEATKSEGRDLIAKGYAEEVDALDASDVEAKASDVADIDDMTGPELKQYLTERGVEFKSSSRVDDLKDLAKSINQS
ncbi:hypothetical protein [Psychrobacter pygoscelis]|uniref:hypothetical protein n=1 Tax=Psychrobacter pygoscelis TaxID=2488563 RepID=UPI00103974B6|nr:hypothetical protein [Psychrobacter pygoscelis]